MPKDLEHILSENRGKILPLSRELVMDCIVTKEQETTRIARVSLPEDTHVRDAYYDPLTGHIMFILYSKEFDPVPSGMQFPLFNAVEMVSLKVVKSGGLNNDRENINTI